MKNTLLMLSLLLLGCSSTLPPKTPQAQWASIFVAHFADYQMDIEAAGIASIPTATLNKETLFIEYAYVSGGENRKGAMTLVLNPDTNRFEGHWQTNADNGNVYQGSLSIRFGKNGEAVGSYTFANSSYRIRLQKVSQ